MLASYEDLRKYEQIYHNVARIMGAIADVYIPNQQDHSHANLAWNAEKNFMISREIDAKMFGKYQLLCSMTQNCIVLLSERESAWRMKTTRFDLTSIQGIQKQLAEKLDFIELKDQSWMEKVELPHPPPSGRMAIAAGTDAQRMFSLNLNNAQDNLQALLAIQNQKSEIRIWPHNFDLGIFCDYGDGITQYAGFAPGDEQVSPTSYYYNSFYKNDEKVVPEGYPALEAGQWKTGDWTGGILALEKMENIYALHKAARTFLKDSTATFLQQLGK